MLQYHRIYEYSVWNLNDFLKPFSIYENGINENIRPFDILKHSETTLIETILRHHNPYSFHNVN